MIMVSCVPGPPSAPTGLSSTVMAASEPPSVRVSWNTVSSADSYTVSFTRVTGSRQVLCLYIRHIAEVVNLSVTNVRYLTRVRHAYTHFKVVVDVFECDYQAGEVVLNGPRDAKWIEIATLRDYPLPRVTHKFLGELMNSSQQSAVSHQQSVGRIS